MARGKPFILVAKALVRDREGRYLFIRRSAASKHFGGYWEMPGGKMDPGEGIDQTLEREVFEETGLRVRDPHVFGASEGDTPEARFIQVIMEVSAEPGTVTLSAEHDEFTWVTPREAVALKLSPVYVACVRNLAHRAQTL